MITAWSDRAFRAPDPAWSSGGLGNRFGIKLVEHLWGEVRAIGPDDGSANRVQSHVREIVWVSKRLEDLSIEQGTYIDLFGGPIIEGQPQRMRATDLGLIYAKDHNYM
jgi:hypothetical protein